MYVENKENQLTAGPLDAARITQAFPLVREIASGLSLDGWLDYAGHFVDDDTDDCGIIVAEMGGYIRGLFTYEAGRELTHGRVLYVRDMIALGMVQRSEVADVLLNSMRHIGRALGCGAIHVHLPDASGWAMSHFQNHGHHVEGATLCCQLGAS